MLAPINGTEIFSAQDATYREGVVRLGMRLANPGDARWDNLVVQRLRRTAAETP